MLKNYKHNHSSKYFFLTLFIFVLSGGFFFTSQCQVPTNAINVLFIGNSLTGFHQMPIMVQELGTAAGKNIYCEGRVIGGTSIGDNCATTDTREKIKERAWDYIILQGDPQSTAFPDDYHLRMPWLEYEPILQTLQEIKQFINANNPNTQIIFFMPWAYEDGMTWIEGQTDTYETMQQKIYDNSLIFAQDLQIPVAPVGWAWNYVWNNGDRDLLFMADFVHPTEYGSYLTACVFYSLIYSERITENTYRPDEITYGNADYLQSVASDIVMDNIDLWNGTQTTNSEITPNITNDFLLYQNYPNPFNPSTTFSFNIAGQGHVSLKIFDTLGREVTTLINRSMSAGNHTVEFSADALNFHLTSGTYFYQLRHKDRLQTKKLVILK